MLTVPAQVAHAYIWQPLTFSQIGGDRSGGGRNAKEMG